MVCDADFSKASLGNLPNDPLDACAKIFVNEFVTDPFVVAKLRGLASNAGIHSRRLQSSRQKCSGQRPNAPLG